MLHSVWKKKVVLQTLSAMSIRGAPVQFLSESVNVPEDTLQSEKTMESVAQTDLPKSVSPIGYIKSCFKSKNGTPRQPSICTFSRAKLEVLKSVFVCPDHSLQGLQQYSHVWIMFLFHKNGPESFTKAKVKPPRLNGVKVGVFATRSPHRPNPIGLTLAKLDKIQGGTLYLSGVDIIDGTPVLDIKPYVPTYDNPANILKPNTPTLMLDQTVIEDVDVKDPTSSTSHKASMNNSGILAGTNSDINNASYKQPHPSDDPTYTGGSARKEVTEQPSSAKESLVLRNDDALSIVDEDNIKVADWIMSPPITKLQIEFTQKAEHQLSAFKPKTPAGTSAGDCVLDFFKNTQEARQAICEILAADPRSTYRRNQCSDRLYFFEVDTIHVTCWFYDNIAEVIRIQPVSQI